MKVSAEVNAMMEDKEVYDQQVREGWCPVHECKMACDYVGGSAEFVEEYPCCRNKEVWNLTADSYEISEIQWKCPKGCHFSVIGLCGGDVVVTEVGK